MFDLLRIASFGGVIEAYGKKWLVIESPIPEHVYAVEYGDDKPFPNQVYFFKRPTPPSPPSNTPSTGPDTMERI